MTFRHIPSAWRRLHRVGGRGYALASIGTLALGIGAVITIYSLLHAVLLAPLALRDEARVVRIAERHDRLGLTEFSVSTANFLSWQEQVSSLQSVAAFSTLGANVVDARGAERVEALVASQDLWRVLGLEPLQGRAASGSAEDLAAAVLISDAYRQRRFGDEPAVLGRSLRVDGRERVIVGIAPADIGLGTHADLWLPMDVQGDAGNRDDRRLTVVARLHDDATLDSTRSELEGIASRLAGQYPDSNEGWSIRVDMARDWLVPVAQRERLTLLMAAVGLLLLVTCGNLAGLQIARAAHRQRELGIRQALGADRNRLSRDVLTETLLLFTGGTILGVLAAWALLHGARAALTSALPAMATIALRPDVAAAAILACAVTALLFGLVPALLASHADPAGALAAGGRSSSSVRRAPLRSALVAGQFAIATVLLVGATLLGTRLLELGRTELGFAPEHVLTARISLPPIADDEELARQQRVFERLLDELATIPGVTSAAVASDAPLGNVDTQMLVAPGPMPTEASDAARHSQSSWRIVSPDYFSTMSIGLLSGRLFRPADEPNESIILGRSVAERIFGAPADAVGKLVTMGNQQRKRVVGVVADTRQRSLTDPMTPTVYLPTSWFLWESMTLTVRSQGDTAALANEVRRRAMAIVPDRPLYDVRPMSAVVADSIAAPRLQASVILAFAAAALLIAAVGVGSVMSYLIARRTSEFALRFALGASPQRVRRSVMASGAALALSGIALGALAVLSLSRLASEALDAAALDIGVGIGVAGVTLMGACLFACWWPAQRAAMIPPAVALGVE